MQPSKLKVARQVHRIQCKKHGFAMPGPALGGWSIEDTGRLFSESPANVSRDINLADALKQYPELLEYQNKSSAQRRLQEIKRNPSGSRASPRFKSEDELQKYLERNWDKTELNRDWELYGREKFDTGEVGIMDLLARHKQEPRWLVVELKVRQAPDATIGQLLRYMGWVKRELAKDDEVVHGLVVSKRATQEILYALERVPNTELRLYQWKSNVLELKPTDFSTYREDKQRALLRKLMREYEE